jgi:hypothetical protein
VIFSLPWIARHAKKATIAGGGNEREGVANQGAPEWPRRPGSPQGLCVVPLLTVTFGL